MAFKNIALALGVSLCLGATGTSVVAAPTYFFPLTQFEDDLLDWHLDVNQSGTIDVGDRVISILQVDFTAPVFGGGSSAAIQPPELTGILDAYVVSKTATGIPGLFNYTFGPTPGGFMSGDLSSLGLTPGIQTQATSGALVGEIVRFWYGPLADLDVIGPNCISFDDCADKASNGTFYFSFGFSGDEQEHFVILNASDSPALILTQAATANLGSANFAASFIDNQSGVEFGLQECATLFCPGGGDGMIAVVGSGQINGGQGLVNGAFARGDFQFQVAPIPEPASIALTGLALLALGAVRRRRISN